MINYNRLGYEIKRDLTSFSPKISKDLKRPQQKYAIERVLSMSRKGINVFLLQKDKSQQLNLLEHFNIEDSGVFMV